MNFDQAPKASESPAEIIVTPEEVKVSAEGKKYSTEEDGVLYGKDFLPKPPAEINIDDNFPPAPPHIPENENPVL